MKYCLCWPQLIFSAHCVAHTSIELLRGSRFRRKPFYRRPDAQIAVGHAYLSRICSFLEKREREKRKYSFYLRMPWPNLTFCSILAIYIPWFQITYLATAPFIDNQFDLAHVFVQIEQASAEWKLNADFSTMSTSLKFKVHNGLPSVPIRCYNNHSFSYKHMIFLSWLLPTCVTNNSWPGRKCRECKPWICDKTMLMSFVRRSRTQSVISQHSAAHPPR